MASLSRLSCPASAILRWVAERAPLEVLHEPRVVVGFGASLLARVKLGLVGGDQFQFDGASGFHLWHCTVPEMTDQERKEGAARSAPI
jgi:hypothetical protein